MDGKFSLYVLVISSQNGYTHSGASPRPTTVHRPGFVHLVRREPWRQRAWKMNSVSEYFMPRVEETGLSPARIRLLLLFDEANYLLA